MKWTTIWWARDDNVAHSTPIEEKEAPKSKKHEANQWWNSWGNKNKNKKSLKRLECVTRSISLIDRGPVDVYKSEASEPYKRKPTKRRRKHIKGEKKYLRKKQWSKSDVDVENWNSSDFRVESFSLLFSWLQLQVYEPRKDLTRVSKLAVFVIWDSFRYQLIN